MPPGGRAALLSRLLVPPPALAPRVAAAARAALLASRSPGEAPAARPAFEREMAVHERPYRTSHSSCSQTVVNAEREARAALAKLRELCYAAGLRGAPGSRPSPAISECLY